MYSYLAIRLSQKDVKGGGSSPLWMLMKRMMMFYMIKKMIGESS